jgi:hypothetical protein
VRFSPPTVAFLVAINLVPVVGVLFLGWDLLSILVLYWIESGVVGILNVARIRRVEAAQRRGETVPGAADAPLFRVSLPSVSPTGSLGGFFVMHYGIFWVVHGVFVFVIPVFAADVGGASPALGYGHVLAPGIALAALGLAISHYLSYRMNFLGRAEYRTTTPEAQMLAPYGRVFVLHFTILFGAFVIAFLGSPLALLLLMVGIKTLIDLGLHVVEYSRASQRAIRHAEAADHGLAGREQPAPRS